MVQTAYDQTEIRMYASMGAVVCKPNCPMCEKFTKKSRNVSSISTTKSNTSRKTMTCEHKHTKFQPNHNEWKCPKCNAGPYYFYIEASMNDDCLQIHEDDEIRCTNCGSYWDGKKVTTLMSKKIETDSVEYVVGQMRQCPQVQYDLTTQLRQLIPAANKLGLYDAADYLHKIADSIEYTDLVFADEGKK